jgi:hypothetical protein
MLEVVWWKGTLMQWWSANAVACVSDTPGAFIGFVKSSIKKTTGESDG